MKLKIFRSISTAALVVASACSSHGTSSVLPGGPATVAPAKGSVASANLSIVVPRSGASTSSNRRRPMWVSPSSAQLKVAVNSGQATVYGLTANAPGCSVVVANITCTFSVAAPAGNDSFALTLLDSAGNVLSQNVVNATLAAGVATPVNVTLNGVPATAVIVPGQNATIDGTATPAFHVPGLFPQPIELEALDADGNVIIGPGAPKFTAPTVSSGSAFATIAPQNFGDPNAYLLKAVDGTAAGQTVTLSTTAQGIPLNDGTTSAPISGNQNFTFTPAIAVAGGPAIIVYSLESGKPIVGLPICSGGCPASFATGIAIDSLGTMYVSWTSSLGLSLGHRVSVYDPGSLGVTRVLDIPQGVTGAVGVAVDKNNMLYVVNVAAGRLLHRTPPSVTEYARGANSPTFQIRPGFAGLNDPTGVAVDGSGNVYVADNSGANASVDVYGPGNQTTAIRTLSDPRLGLAASIVADNGGNVYVSDVTNKDLAYFPAGSTSASAIITDGSFAVEPAGMMIDPSGNLWVSISGSTSIVEELSGTALPGSVSIIDTLPTGGNLGWIP